MGLEPSFLFDREGSGFLYIYIFGCLGQIRPAISCLDVPLEVRIKGDRISGLFHPNFKKQVNCWKAVNDSGRSMK